MPQMFFAMGISWLAEFTSWLFEWRYGRHQGWVVKARQGCSANRIFVDQKVTSITEFGPHLTSAVCDSFLFDLINAAQGVILFAVLNFDSATIRNIRYRKHYFSTVTVSYEIDFDTVSFMTYVPEISPNSSWKGREGEKGE